MSDAKSDANCDASSDANRDASSDANREERPVVCRKLRTKMAFGSHAGAPDWREGDSTTATYWCLCTMESAGPDDDFAHAKKCRQGRSCFVGPDVA